MAMHGVLLPLLASGLYFLLALSTIDFASRDGGVAVIWPANAAMIAILMRQPPAKWPGIVMGAFVGGVAATSIAREMSHTAPLFAAANMAEIVIAAFATGVTGTKIGLLENNRIMVRFALFAGLAAPAVSAAPGAAIVWGFYGQPYWHSYGIWLFSDALGILIFTPFFYALFTGRYLRAYRETTVRRRWEAVLLVALTGLVAAVVFMAERPLLFLIIMPTMLVAFRVGYMGVKISAILIAVVGSVTTTAGHGPLIPLSPDPVTRAQFLQIFLLSQLLTHWPVVAALRARNRLTLQLEKSEQSLHILARQSSVLMLTFDVAGICRKVVGAADLLSDRTADMLPGTPIEALTTTEGTILRAAHELALDIPDRQHSIELFVGAGEHRWLEATFRALDDEGSRCPGTLMTLHDISVRKEQTLALALSAQTDSLTGLLNRAGFMARLERALRSAPTGTLGLAMIDVDRFKLVNDNCGHQTGDCVLEEVARRISGEIRSSDVVGRLGGDEFVVLLSAADWDSAKDVCRRLVETVNALPVTLPSGQELTVAISCGVAPYRPGTSAERFLHEADVALYAAKRAGRNQMVAA